MLDTAAARSRPRDFTLTEAHQPSLDFTAFVRALARYKRLIIASAIIGGILAALYLTLAAPHYTATSMVLIDSHKNQLLEGQQVLADPQLDAGLIESQTEILRSEEVAVQVVRKLSLASNPEFNGSRKNLIGTALAWIASIQSRLSNADHGVPVTPERIAVRTVVENLTAKRVGLSYVIEVDFTSLDPKTASVVANAVTEAYTSGELAARYDATKRSAVWLESRIDELKSQATQSDEAVQQFKTQNSIVDTSRGLMSEQALTDLNSQLLQAKESMSEADARVRQIKAVIASESATSVGSVSDALHSDVVNRLRAQYLDLAAKERDYSARYGVNHRVTVLLRGQMVEINRSVRDEMLRIYETYKSDYAVARARTDTLQTALDKLVTQVGENSKSRVQLRDLESSAQTYRMLYDSYLQKLSQTTQQQNIPITEARIITRATSPSKRSYPKIPLITAGGIFGGLFSGVAFAFARETLNARFRTVSEVQIATGLACLGVLPNIGRRRRRSTRGSIDRQTKYRAAFVKRAPFSRYSETLRHVKIAIDQLAEAKGGVKVIGIISSLPGEGKSTIAANYASLIAASGYKTLLIDCDLRNPGLTRMITKSASRPGLFGKPKDEGIKEGSIEHLDDTLDFLPCKGSGRLNDTARILSSASMASTVASACLAYDFIVMDFAPVSVVVDVKAAAGFVDAYLMVVEWDQTSKNAVLSTLESLDFLRDRIIGIVLNGANPKLLKYYESHFGKRYLSYYHEN